MSIISTNSTIITRIYKSRLNILKQLETRGYDIENYNEFSISEIYTLYNNKQLDMLLENSQGHKVYVKYNINKNLTSTNIYNTLSDLYDIENVLNSKTDEVLFIINDEPNDTLNDIMKYLYNSENKYINIVNIKRLQYNVLEHSLVPPHEILTDAEETELKEKMSIHNPSKQLPLIDRFDPISIAIGLRPGRICKIIRSSRTSITTNYYRYCV